MIEALRVLSPDDDDQIPYEVYSFLSTLPDFSLEASQFGMDCLLWETYQEEYEYGNLGLYAAYMGSVECIKFLYGEKLICPTSVTELTGRTALHIVAETFNEKHDEKRE